MVRVAVVGTGWQGQGLLSSLAKMDSVQLVGVCDLNPQMLQKAAAKFSAAPFDDYSQMLEQTSPEGVVICTPPAARFELVKAAAERGIHCFVEKPPAKDLAAAARVTEVLDQTGVINSVGFMYRYSRAAKKCRELLQGRRVALVRSQFLDGLALRPNWPRWFFDKSRSGGPIFDQAIHMFDLCRFLLGEVAAVSGFQANLTVPKADDFTVEDSFSLALQYRSGVLQNHSHSWSYPTYTCSIEFISDELHLVLDLARHTVSGQIEGEAVSHDFTGDAFYQMELEAFVQAVREQRQELIQSTYRDSVQSLAVAIAASRALEEATVVRL